MNREFIWEVIICLCNFFLLLFDKFHSVFYNCLKYIRCVYRKLILKFVDDENDLHRGDLVVDYNILIL